MRLFSEAMFYFSFTAEIIVASLMFAHFFERRRFGAAVFAVGLILMCLVAYFWNPGFERVEVVSLSLKYIAFYLIVILMLHLTFRCGFLGAVFCATMGYCLQHVTYNTYRVAAHFMGIRLSSVPGTDNLSDDLIHLSWFCLVYLVLILVIRRTYGKHKEMMRRQFMKNRKLIVFGAVFIIIATFLDNISYSIFTDLMIADRFFLINLYLALLAACIAYILLSVVKEEKAMEELASMKLLLHSQEKVYRSNKELIDSLNLKAHDLKHQIHALGGRIPKKEAEEMEEMVNRYDAALHTGSEALDIVLAEKGAHCVNNGIHLSCFLDGSHLEDFSDSDIYSFFGNALDNAIEAVEKLEEEKRIISITEKQQGDFRNIRIENYCQAGIPFRPEGLPATTKDTRYHGFGTKSMKHIAEKYGAELFFRQEGERFVVNLLLPERHS